MDFRDTLSTLMPAPRDDEPASLRQDILDELGDHLACAFNRELLRGANSQLARRRVLERFGDPVAVARRLWLDAMKGKIMAQRVLIATCLVVAPASLSLVGLVWVQSNRAAAQTNEANRQLSAALPQSQIVNTNMLKTLNEMSEAIRNPRSPDWNPVKIKLTEETTDGPPVPGCAVSLSQRGADKANINRTTDASGVADFGLLHPGEFFFHFSRSWDERLADGSGQLNVEPGSDVNKVIVSPKKALERVAVRVHCNWPTDLSKEGLVVDAPFKLDPLYIDGTSWSINTRSVLCGPADSVMEILEPNGLYLWATALPPTLRADILTSHMRSIDQTSRSLKWERGTYRLSELIVLRLIREPTGTAGRQRFEILARCSPWNANNQYGFHREPPSDDKLRYPGHLLGARETTAMQGIVIPGKSWAEIPDSFEARPDQVIEWTITLPERLINLVRERLSTERKGKSG